MTQTGILFLILLIGVTSNIVTMAKVTVHKTVVLRFAHRQISMVVRKVTHITI